MIHKLEDVETAEASRSDTREKFMPGGRATFRSALFGGGHGPQEMQQQQPAHSTSFQPSLAVCACVPFVGRVALRVAGWLAYFGLGAAQERRGNIEAKALRSLPAASGCQSEINTCCLRVENV